MNYHTPYMGVVRTEMTEIADSADVMAEYNAAQQKSDFSWQNFVNGANDLIAALNPLSQRIITEASTSARQKRELEADIAKADIFGRMNLMNTVKTPLGEAPGVLVYGVPLAILAGVLISRKRSRRRRR